MQLQGRLGVVASVAIHALELAKLVDVPGGVGEQFRNPGAALAVLLEVKDGTGVGFFAGLRLVVKGVEMGGTAAHEQKDHALGAGGQGGGLRLEAGTDETLHRQVTETAGSGLQHLAA